MAPVPLAALEIGGELAEGPLDDLGLEPVPVRGGLADVGVEVSLRALIRTVEEDSHE